MKAFPTKAFFYFFVKMTEHETSFTFSARYYKLGELSADTKQIWFVLHGYGQLGRYFLNKFESIVEKNICVIAPEGLSRFYLETPSQSKRKSDRVGATWMTRENREMDIENYIRYLDNVYTQEIKDRKLPVTVLGFSQGAATASRWVMRGNVKFDRLVLWAGIFPPDMNFESGSAILQSREVIFVYGKRDPFLTAERFKEMEALTAKLKITPKIITFDGEHDIDKGALLDINGVLPQ